MESTAQLNYLRMSPRKVKLVIDLVRGQRVTVALQRLAVLPQSAALPVAKLIKSAVANATGAAAADLWVREIMVGQGPRLKRFTPRAMGRATPILRPTCHIQLALSDAAPQPKKLSSK